MRYKYILIRIFCIYSFIGRSYLSAQVLEKEITGEGASSFYSKDIAFINAKQEALLKAQKNALVNFGGLINFKSDASTTDKTNITGSKNGSNNTTRETNLKYHESMNQLMSGIVKPIGEVHYEQMGKKKEKYVVATGKFTVDIKNMNENLKKMAQLYVNYSGRKIYVDFRVKGCELIKKYLREYLTNNNDLFNFPPEGSFWNFGSGDFTIEIFNDYIELHDRGSGRDVTNKKYCGLVFKTFTYLDCKSALVDKNSESGLFFKIENEIYKHYLSSVSNDL
jgi:hypothetical protein